MTTDLKEPKTWSAPSIPGLVRKKKGVKQVMGEVATAKDEPAPVKEEPVVAQKDVVNSDTLFREAILNPVDAHRDLMGCVVDAQALLTKLGAASDSYYTLCDYVSNNDLGPSHTPVLGRILQAVCIKDPTMIDEIVEMQADDIVESWSGLLDVAKKAVAICQLLTEQSRAQAIDQELHKLDQ